MDGGGIEVAGRAARRRALSAEEIEARLPVWDAIADLFLDTVIDEATLDRVARELAASPFTAKELHEIYLHEVAPVVHRNLKIVAGAWAGFGRPWLRERIPAHLARAGPLSRWWAASRPGRWWRLAGTRRDWAAVIHRVQAIRGAA